MPDAQVRLRELLEIPIYRKFFVSHPELPEVATREGCPWRVYVQMEPGGKWAKSDFQNYVRAFRFLKRFLDQGCWDAAIVSRRIRFQPPGRWVKVVKNGRPVWDRDSEGRIKRDGAGNKRQRQRYVLMRMPPGHKWCPHCRRPTVFGWFSRHHAFPARAEIPYEPGHLRCTICGIREASIDWHGGSK